MLYLQILGLDKKHPGLLQMSWNYMNDALRTNVFVEYSPETVACACIYLSARKLRIIMPVDPEFYEVFEMKEEDIISICKRIVRLYKISKVTLDELEDRVKELRNKFEKDREKSKIVTSTAENTPNGNKSSPNGATPPSVGKNHLNKRSRSNSKSGSHSNSQSSSKSGSSSSSSSVKNYKLDRSKEYNADRKMKKLQKEKSYSPSPSRTLDRKKYKSKYQDTSPISRSYNHDRYKYRDGRREDKDSRSRDYYRHYDYNKKKGKR